MERSPRDLPPILRDFLTAIGVHDNYLARLLQCSTVDEYACHCVQLHIALKNYADAATLYDKIRKTGLRRYMRNHTCINGGLSPDLFRVAAEKLASEDWSLRPTDEERLENISLTEIVRRERNNGPPAKRVCSEVSFIEKKNNVDSSAA